MNLDSYATPEAESLLRSAQERHFDHDQARRVLITEAVGAAVFLVGAGLLAGFGPRTRSLSLSALAVTAVVYLVASRVRFPVGSAWTAPTQLVFVPMLFVLPTPLVPLIVAACSVIDLWPYLLRPGLSLTRVFARVGDSLYSLGPVLVLVLAGEQNFSWDHWPLLLLAFAAQMISDCTGGLTRSWFAERLRPSTQLPMVWLYVTDAGLSCVGVVIAASAVTRPGLVLMALPLIGLLALFAHERQQRLERTLALSTAYRGTALLLGEVVDAVHPYTGIHSRQVVDLSLALAEVLGLDATARRNAEFAALLHDVGKIRVPPEILNKPSELDVAEREIMRRHPIEGETMLKQVGGTLSSVGWFVRFSHERYDGQGYPDGLSGEAIPIESRIISVCDAYDAMTSVRPYAGARPVSEARAELRRCAGSQFDPRVVDAMDQALSATSLALRDLTIGEAAPPPRTRPVRGDRAAAAARDESAAKRDEVAIDRDLAAAKRDRLARFQDEQSHRNDSEAALAALDREHAAQDREHAAQDRGHAAQDRERADRYRDEAAQALEALTVDELTKTRRRGPGLDELQREIDRARRTNQQLAVARVDVDGLKAINDTRGNAAGDALLVSVVDALRSDLRSYDLIVRLGGDEFLCVLPGVGIDVARSALDHVRDWIAESTEHASISVGFAQLDPEDTYEGLIARADENLIANRGQGPAPARK
jgi:diguanylate cyclase (GGDEF)-like protein